MSDSGHAHQYGKKRLARLSDSLVPQCLRHNFELSVGMTDTGTSTTDPCDSTKQSQAEGGKGSRGLYALSSRVRFK